MRSGNYRTCAVPESGYWCVRLSVRIGGMQMRRVLATLATVVCALFLPAAVYAQASIAGVVRDASGGVLPGVTVEAASPALIEKVRTAVSDSNGRYRIEDLDRKSTRLNSSHS